WSPAAWAMTAASPRSASRTTWAGRRAANAAASSRCGSGPTQTPGAAAPCGNRRVSSTWPCAATTIEVPPASAFPAPAGSAWAVRSSAPSVPASRAASARATSQAYSGSEVESGTSTVAVATRPEASWPGWRARSPGSSTSRPSRSSGREFGASGMVPSQPAGNRQGNAILGIAADARPRRGPGSLPVSRVRAIERALYDQERTPPMDVIEFRPDRDQYAFTFGGVAPVRKVQPGAMLQLWTDDAFCGNLRDPADMPSAKLTMPFVNPQTGPFYVEGAEPGDTLALHFVE